MSWQPIETMQEGDYGLVWCPTKQAKWTKQTTALRTKGGWELASGGNKISPTHWMPLPAPPEDTPNAD